MFQHFVITRFNLRQKDWVTSKSNNQVLTDEWMENRLRLFTHYCFPSLLMQSEQNFTWLVFFDITTPVKYRSIISQLQQQFPNFMPIFIDGMDEFYQQTKREIKQRLTQPFVITSRLDNDDSLHKNYIKEVQSHFNQQAFMAIDFVDGYTLQIEPYVRFAKRSHTHNPFLSLIESSAHFKTVWFINRHGQWSKIKQLTSVRHKPMWMSVIHMENKVNEFLGFGRVDWHEIDNFNLASSEQAKLASQKKCFESWKWRSFRNKFKTDWKVNVKLLKRMLTGCYYSGSKRQLILVKD